MKNLLTSTCLCLLTLVAGATGAGAVTQYQVLENPDGTVDAVVLSYADGSLAVLDQTVLENNAKQWVSTLAYSLDAQSSLDIHFSYTQEENDTYELVLTDGTSQITFSSEELDASNLDRHLATVDARITTGSNVVSEYKGGFYAGAFGCDLDTGFGGGKEALRDFRDRALGGSLGDDLRRLADVTLVRPSSEVTTIVQLATAYLGLQAPGAPGLPGSGPIYPDGCGSADDADCGPGDTGSMDECNDCCTECRDDACDDGCDDLWVASDLCEGMCRGINFHAGCQADCILEEADSGFSGGSSPF